MGNEMKGKAALLAAAASAEHPTENCVLCGRFMPLTDRLPTTKGYAHVVCLLTKGSAK